MLLSLHKGQSTKIVWFELPRRLERSSGMLLQAPHGGRRPRRLQASGSRLQAARAARLEGSRGLEEGSRGGSRGLEEARGGGSRRLEGARGLGASRP